MRQTISNTNRQTNQTQDRDQAVNWWGQILRKAFILLFLPDQRMLDLHEWTSL